MCIAFQSSFFYYNRRQLFRTIWSEKYVREIVFLRLKPCLILKNHKSIFFSYIFCNVLVFTLVRRKPGKHKLTGYVGTKSTNQLRHTLTRVIKPPSLDHSDLHLIGLSDIPWTIKYTVLINNYTCYFSVCSFV